MKFHISRLVLSYSMLWQSILCETPQIADPPSPDPSEIPLYGPSGQPQENDIQQGMTPDCFLEAALAAIVRVDPSTITTMLHDDGAHVDVFMHNTTSPTTVTVLKKDFEERLRSQDSTSSWVAVMQDAYQKVLELGNLPDTVHNGEGSSPSLAFSAIYGFTPAIRIASCADMASIGSHADALPTTFSTSDREGELVAQHTYTVHTANHSSMTLRNPWGIINENAWGTPIVGGANIQSLGNGTFSIPISSAALQCSGLTFVEMSDVKSPKYKRSSITKGRHARRGNVTVIIVVCAVVLLIILIVALSTWLEREREIEREVNADT